MGEPTHIPLGVHLKQLREAAGLTQEDLAEKSGVSKETISLVERGQVRNPHRDTIRRLTEALGLEGEASTALSTPQHAPRHKPPTSKVTHAPPASPHPDALGEGRTGTWRRGAIATGVLLAGLTATVAALFVNLQPNEREGREAGDRAVAPGISTAGPSSPAAVAAQDVTPTARSVTLATPLSLQSPSTSNPSPTVPGSALPAAVIRVPGESNRGVQFRVAQSGFYTFRYRTGAYAVLPPENAPSGTGVWSTTVLIFKAAQAEWGGWRDQNLEVGLALLRVADLGKWPSEAQAEEAASGMSVDAYLTRGDEVTFVAVDQRSSYGDNAGQVILEVWLRPH